MAIFSARADEIVEPASHDKVCRTVASAGGKCKLVKLDGAKHELFIEGDATRRRGGDAMLRFVDDVSSP